MSLPAIDLRDVTLVRRTQQELHYDIKRTLLNITRGLRRNVKRHTVIDTMTVRIEHGEKVGVIGPNGSGKSTVLKLIAGVLRPTVGTVAVEGSLAPLIEIGVGFDPELNLVDNILYYGVLLGHEEAVVHAHVESILEFAELVAIRDQPTKTLSSGMSARLGFAIATEFRPDILLLDEVLAVGDERFRRKCGARIERFWDAHSTIVLVSHDLPHIVRTCERVIWLDGGKVRFDGEAATAVQSYLNSVPETQSFRSGEDLIAMAAERENGELLIRARSAEPEAKIFLIHDGHRRKIGADEWYGWSGFSTYEVIMVDEAIIEEIPERNPQTEDAAEHDAVT
jgi:ABC-type polysaccharide/polyol phosphate transport system ATPase subunit